MKPDALIFDMDGTLMNNNPYHFKAWQVFYERYHRSLTLAEYKEKISGRTSVEIFQTFFGKEMTPEEITKYANEKNLLYRQLYAKDIKPLEGLLSFLQQIKNAGIPMCIATSGTPQNVRFMFEHIPMSQYFSHVVDSSEVTRGKPNPEIFLTAAAYVNADPAKSVIFEDSCNGIAAAKAAGAKVIGVATMEKKEELAKEVDFVIEDYTEIDLKKIEQLFGR